MKAPGFQLQSAQLPASVLTIHPQRKDLDAEALSFDAPRHHTLYVVPLQE
jgi:hypothetical protein